MSKLDFSVFCNYTPMRFLAIPVPATCKRFIGRDEEEDAKRVKFVDNLLTKLRFEKAERELMREDR